MGNSLAHPILRLLHFVLKETSLKGEDLWCVCGSDFRLFKDMIAQIRTPFLREGEKVYKICTASCLSVLIAIGIVRVITMPSEIIH